MHLEGVQQQRALPTETGNTEMFSIQACCGVIDGYGFGENTFVAILRELKARNMIRNGYVNQKDLNKVIREYQL